MQEKLPQVMENHFLIGIFLDILRNQYRQIGNAVPPLLMYQIGKIIKNITMKQIKPQLHL